MADRTRFPDVVVTLPGDAQPGMVRSRVQRALIAAGHADDAKRYVEATDFVKDSMKALLEATRGWVTIDGAFAEQSPETSASGTCASCGLGHEAHQRFCEGCGAAVDRPSAQQASIGQLVEEDPAVKKAQAQLAEAQAQARERIERELRQKEQSVARKETEQRLAELEREAEELRTRLAR